MRCVLFVLMFTSCSTPKEPPSINIVVESVRALDKDTRCTRMYNGEGPLVLYSARCVLPDKSIAYCRLTIESKILECAPLYPAQGTPKADAGKPKTEAEAVAPQPPPDGKTP